MQFAIDIPKSPPLYSSLVTVAIKCQFTLHSDVCLRHDMISVVNSNAHWKIPTKKGSLDDFPCMDFMKVLSYSKDARGAWNPRKFWTVMSGTHRFCQFYHIGLCFTLEFWRFTSDWHPLFQIPNLKVS